ncbi:MULTISPECIES: hypothetical protein [unclassified Gilliamella]|uniref:hypothetical protein n=1 Tax=unclassified Gilliamella TaxID=2685620 RepID=UPI002269C1F0|nr:MULTISPECIES: hypothetical protein [unclassified Gilliamella]MCX8584822.1 hypothetical protein [Gilliamella sp. B3562]MCX8684469.1 hypothetical protein [Gilliamella sp. B2864]
MVFFLPFSGHALTSQTTRNAIQGSAPYLTFDGGRTRAVDTNGLLGITLSDGTRYTPSTNPSSSSAPISLPVVGQSFADIRMFVPTNTNSVALSSLIGPPNNYWGDDDGDSDVTATGSLSLSIVDKNNQVVSRNSVLTVCNAPYKVTLSSSNGTLSTRYGVPNRSTFSASNVTYYVNPKASPVICFARPNLKFGKLGDDSYYPSFDFAGPSSMWDPANGFIPQSTGPSSYGRNFPTTGANGLYFDLLISGSSQPLSWSPVSQGGITVTMSNSTATSVRVTLTGPYATESQHNSRNPDPISKPTLPQTFELVGRDTNGIPVVKYGFTLKQWFVHRGSKEDTYPNTLSWCNSLGYQVPRVKDLTNASCRGEYSGSYCRGSVGATPSSPNNLYMRHIDAGFFAEWGFMYDYSGVGFIDFYYWTSDSYDNNRQFLVYANYGTVHYGTVDGGPDIYYTDYSLCSHP